MTEIIVTIRCAIEAGPESIWFTEDELASMSDNDVRELLEEDIYEIYSNGTMTIERRP